MRTPHQFQTRLALALILSTVGVSGAVLWITSRIVIRHEERQFTRQFHSQVEYVLQSRERRSQGIREHAREFVRQPRLIATLRESGSRKPNADLAQEFWQFRNGGDRRRGAGPSRGDEAKREERSRSLGRTPARFSGSLPVVALVSLEGEVFPLSPGRISLGPRARHHLKTAYHLQGEELASALQEDEQQVTYLAVESPQGAEMIQEVVVTSVLDPASGELLGAFLVGVPAETGAERMLDRFQQNLERNPSFKSGIYLDGEIYTRTLPEAHLEELAATVSTGIHDGSRLTTGGEGRGAVGEATVTLGGEVHRLHYCALNPDSSLPVAWQIAAYSLAGTHAELRSILSRGAAVGMLALVLALLTSVLLSRSLSVPVRELSSATEEVRRGNLDAKVPVRGRDELARLAHSFNTMAEELEQKERFRELLEKVSDETVAQAMISGSLDVQLGGELKTVTILFCDIRGFTGLTEEMAPDDVISLLNDHMTAMTGIIRECHGVVDKFVGDEIMAVFGALKSYGNDAANAARAALRMVEERERRNRHLAVPFQLGIGIATGEVVAGCMGSTDRLNYTVLGARVNLASRLCGLAGSGEILLDEETRVRLSEPEFPMTSLPAREIRGFSKPVRSFRLAGLTEAASREKPSASPAVA